jgi:hypothetical protein
VEGTVLASVNAIYIQHHVRFGGLSEGGLLGTGLGYVELEVDTSDVSGLDESRMVRDRCKRGSSWSHSVGATSQQGSKQLKGYDQTYVYPPLAHGMDSNWAVQRSASPRAQTVQAASRLDKECLTSSHNTQSKQQVGEHGVPTL